MTSVPKQRCSELGKDCKLYIEVFGRVETDGNIKR